MVFFYIIIILFVIPEMLVWKSSSVQETALLLWTNDLLLANAEP